MDFLSNLFKGFQSTNLGGDVSKGSAGGFDWSQFGSGMTDSISSGAKSLGGMFQGMDIKDMANIGKLGLGFKQYQDAKGAYEDEKEARDETRGQIREDRKYNTDVRDRARRLRF